MSGKYEVNYQPAYSSPYSEGLRGLAGGLLCQSVSFHLSVGARLSSAVADRFQRLSVSIHTAVTITHLCAFLLSFNPRPCLSALSLSITNDAFAVPVNHTVLGPVCGGPSYQIPVVPGSGLVLDLLPRQLCLSILFGINLPVKVSL